LEDWELLGPQTSHLNRHEAFEMFKAVLIPKPSAPKKWWYHFFKRQGQMLSVSVPRAKRISDFGTFSDFLV
jgi:hypothetical protein